MKRVGTCSRRGTPMTFLLPDGSLLYSPPDALGKVLAALFLRGVRHAVTRDQRGLDLPFPGSRWGMTTHVHWTCGWRPIAERALSRQDAVRRHVQAPWRRGVWAKG